MTSFRTFPKQRHFVVIPNKDKTNWWWIHEGSSSLKAPEMLQSDKSVCDQNASTSVQWKNFSSQQESIATPHFSFWFSINIEIMFPVVATSIIFLCGWPRCSYIQVVDTTPTNLWHGVAAAPLIQSENGKCRLPAASCRGALNQVYVHTLVSTGPTHARLDATLESRSGDCQRKRKFHYSHTTFYSFPAQIKWFSCVPRDKYKTGKRHSRLHFQ